jgi:tRNA pseudouridine38-40 synthase
VRVALGISYNGRAYQGWQSQTSGQTIQDQLEKALGKFAAQRVSTLCAGRTDAGVHGIMQVVHFDTPLERDTYSWVRGTNANLPRDIAVQWAVLTPDAFHCRASAQSRRYAYVLLESPIRPSIEVGRVGWTFQSLDMDAMRAGADLLLGEHDFTSFRASECQALSPVKTMLDIALHRRGAYLALRIRSQRLFAPHDSKHHGLLGTAIGTWQIPATLDGRGDLMATRDQLQECGPPTFSPDGLYFLGPRYDTERWAPARSRTACV